MTEQTPTTADEGGPRDGESPEEFIGRIFQDALGGPGNAKVTVINSPEELAAKLAEFGAAALTEQQEEDRLTEMALNMTSEQAGHFAASAMLGAGREHDMGKGHAKHARFRLEAASVWLQLAEFLERKEERERRKPREETMNKIREKLESYGYPRHDHNHFSAFAQDIPASGSRWDRVQENVGEPTSSGNGE